MTKITKLVVSLSVVCLLVVLGSTSAQADQYAIGQSSQTIGITSSGGGSVGVTFGHCAAVGGNSVCTLSGGAVLEPAFAPTSYILEELYTGTGSSPVTAGPGVGGIFGINMNGATAQVSFNGGTTFSAVDYSLISDGSPNPKFSGTWDVSGAWLPFDYTLKNINALGVCSLGSACTLDAVSMQSGATINSDISSGEFVTPEPASLSLFGIGLLGFAFFFRRQLRMTA